MEIALWILGGWFGLAVAMAVWVAGFIRHGRVADRMPLRSARSGLSQPNPCTPHP